MAEGAKVVAAKVRAWVDGRLPLSAVTVSLTSKTVPVHRATVLYYFGGLSFFFFLVQIFTGLLLMLYYRPAASEAFESIELIVTTAPFGWLIRSVHVWSSHLMVFFVLVHLSTVYFTKAYRPPREMGWMSGVALLFLTLGFAFTGCLLPWDSLAFFATKVAAGSAGSLPVLGDSLVSLVQGGDRVSGTTLTRFYALHVAYLPLATASLLALHLLLVHKHGLSVPRSAQMEARSRPSTRFYPDFLMRDLFNVLLAIAALAILATLFPRPLGEKADAFAPAYEGIRPEWYFLFAFQTLKLIPGGSFAGIEYEAFPLAIFGGVSLLMVLVPFLDRGAARTGQSPGFTVAGVLVLLYCVVMTCLGRGSLMPAWIALSTTALLAARIGLERRRQGRERS